MTTPAHVLSAAYIALIVNAVAPTQTPVVIAALIAASVVDLDHLYFIAKDHAIMKRGKLHKARSMFHELVGFIIIGVIVLIVGFYNQQLAKVLGVAMMIHLAEDMIVGISIPFSPIDKTEVQLLPQKMKLKIVLDVATIIIFGILWIQYLNGPVWR